MIESVVVFILGILGVVFYLFRNNPSDHEQQIKEVEIKKEAAIEKKTREMDNDSIDELINDHNSEIKRRDSKDK